ncbi:HAD family hydrolase [Roseibium algae]|uniref:HAD family phosphatase n=1 Tax=Roseibium algae TaxID=3123038 RepID=A0ABU8TPZ7_9HYPH
MTTPVTTVVFDVGNVLIEWGPEHLYRELIPDTVERTSFLTHICSMEWNLQQDLGRNWSEAIALLSSEYPEHADLIAAYSSRWHDMVPGEISGSVRILEDLKRSKTPLYAITNFSSEKFNEAQERFSFLKTSFSDIVVSAEEGLLKPDVRIYEVLFSRNKLDPSACVFIDDSEKNVLGAREAGMQALHFTSAEKLRADLIDMDFPL